MARFGAGAIGKAEVLRIDDPTRLAKLLINEETGLGLVEVNVRGGRGGCFDERSGNGRGLGGGGGLLRREAGLELRFLGFNFSGQILPEGLFVFRGLELFLEGVELLRLLW